ncbi:MAG: hypothetical protein DRG78_01780 [Epsilonproteobacteria bacterium]|nr:MAG: hypothetical protein DRG78_01780 [Campylobacterota bacterium]
MTALELKEKVKISREVFRAEFLKHKSFNENFIITKDTNGNPVSFFKDDIWDLSSYRLSPKDKITLNFLKITNKNIRNEAKKLIILIMIYKRGVNDNMLSNDTIVKTYYNGTIYKIAKYAQDNSITIKELLENNMKLFYFIKNELQISCYNGVKALLNFLYTLNNQISNINYKKDTKLTDYLKYKHAQYRKSRNQVEVIPTRILNKVIQYKIAQIDEINEASDELLVFIDKILFDKKKDISEFTIKKFFIKYNITSREKFSTFFGKLQKTVKSLIHAYTGMRNNEVNTLYINCFEYHENKDKNLHYYTIKGYSTKLEGKSYEKWVTSKKIKVAINVMEKLNIALLKKLNYKIDEIPLFIRRGILFKYKKEELIDNLMANIESVRGLNHTKILITEDDILELENIEPFRDWRNDKEFEIGGEWQLKSHQFRRTLVVYSVQSGLVSLGSLQLQLKHLVRDMTLYYGNGATFAKKLFNVSSDHPGKDIAEIENEFNALSYIKNVILSNEKLYGAHGHFIEKNKKVENMSLKDYVLNDREDTLEKTKNGEERYSSTAIGGCMTIKECDHKIIGVISACLECDSAIVEINKLDQTITELELFISKLNINSLEYRSENNELDALKQYRQKIIGKNK